MHGDVWNCIEKRLCVIHVDIAMLGPGSRVVADDRVSATCKIQESVYALIPKVFQ